MNPVATFAMGIITSTLALFAAVMSSEAYGLHRKQMDEAFASGEKLGREQGALYGKRLMWNATMRSRRTFRKHCGAEAAVCLVEQQSA